MKPSILVLISDDLYLRSYISTDAFSKVKEKYNVRICISDKVKGLEVSNELSGFCGVYTISEKVRKSAIKIFNLYMWKYRELSKSFIYRYERELGIQLLYGKSSCFIKLLRFLKFSIIKSRCWFILLPLFSSGVLFEITKKYLRKDLVIPKSLINILKKENPDVIIVPSTNYEIESALIKDIGLISQSKTILLIDNWDNLSSKSLLWQKPDYMAVWGQQSIQHAVDIQKMDVNKVVALGTPRYDKYFSVRSNYVPSHFDFPYMLFTGCNMAFDEISALKELDNIISDNQEVFEGVKIIYRPHPWREPRMSPDRFKLKDYKHTILDPQLADIYDKTAEERRAIQPSLNYYPSLLKNAEFIIAPLSSMVIESIIFYKKVLILAHDDKYHYTTPKRNLKNFEHLNTIYDSPSLNFSNSLEDLSSSFLKAYEYRNDNDKVLSDQFLKNVLYFNDQSYPERLKDFLDHVCEQ